MDTYKFWRLCPPLCPPISGYTIVFSSLSSARWCTTWPPVPRWRLCPTLTSMSHLPNHHQNRSGRLPDHSWRRNRFPLAKCPLPVPSGWDIVVFCQREALLSEWAPKWINIIIFILQFCERSEKNFTNGKGVQNRGAHAYKKWILKMFQFSNRDVSSIYRFRRPGSGGPARI